MSELDALAQPAIATGDPHDGTLAGRFERQAALTPDNIAVVMDEGSVSYRGLDTMAGRIAAGLGRMRDTHRPVALMLPEGPLLYAAMLAAAKANRIFVPLELTTPESWLSNIVSNSGIAHILTDRSTFAAAEKLAGPDVTVLAAEDLQRNADSQLCASSASDSAPAYVIYTSGSTGRPKGVAISNRGALHRVLTRTERSRIKPGDRLAHLRSSGFVAGITNVFATLLNGATVLPFDVSKYGFRKLASWLVAQEITSFTITSSLLRTWLASLPEDCKFPKLRVVAVGSEPLYAADLACIAQHLVGDWLLVHSCGTTETGAFASGVFGPKSSIEQGILPVGKTLPGYEVLLEKEDRSIAASGEVGEIIVKSAFLALGYWKEPALTASAFLAEGDACIYRTGDLGRWRKDGNLEHLGRKDRKVKLRGYTIELYEVECGLLAIAGIRDAVVILHKDDPENSRLVAYVAASKDIANPTGQWLRSELAKRLPLYMVPADIVFLDALPLTGRGKVDRSALPPPPDPAENRCKASRGPSGEREHRLAAIWQEVLKIPNIGADDDFYELGGTSLQALLIFARIATTFGRDFPPTRMIQAATIARQAELLLGDSGASAAQTLVPFRTEGSAAPLFIVHGVFGDIMFGRELVRGLKSDRPVYGVQPPPLDGTHLVPRKMEDIAAAYLAEIRKVQPNGPYFLAGYSFGGTAALEMAQQLTRAGERVAFLGMIDTDYDGRYEVAGEQAVSRIARHMHQMRRQNMLAYLGKRVLNTLGYYAAMARETAQQLPNELRSLFGRPIPYEERAPCYRRIYLRASFRYTPRPYPGSIAICARKGAAEWHRERWRPIALGGLTVRETPANHFDIVWPPYSTMVAEWFDACLDSSSS